MEKVTEKTTESLGNRLTDIALRVISEGLYGNGKSKEEITIKDKEIVKIKLCDSLLQELSKLTGKDIAPCLSEVVYHRKENYLEVKFKFPDVL